MMKILLLNPISKKNEAIIRNGRCQTKSVGGIGIWPPIDLVRIGTLLNHKLGLVNVEIYDSNIDCSYQNMRDMLSEYAADIVLINSITPLINSDIELAYFIKSINPRAKIIFFGIHVSVRPEDAIYSGSPVDFVIIGEPELTILELTKTICEKEDYKMLNNIAFWDNDRITQTDIVANIKDLDCLLIPDRSLINNEFYVLPYNNEPFTIIETSRGCNQKCIYCTASVYRDGVIKRSANSVLDEIEEVVEKYNIKNFMFLADTFTMNKNYVKEICHGIKQRGINIKWMANTRVDSIDEELLKIMKDAGCWLLSIGIESGSNEILKNALKKIDTGQVEKCIEVINRNGLKTIGYFMFGLPGEDKDTIEETISFSLKLKLDYAYFFVATPFPGTMFYKYAEDSGILKSKDWERYYHGESDVIEYSHLSSKDLQKAIAKAYRKFYFRPGKVINYLVDRDSGFKLKNYMNAGTSVLKKVIKK